MKPRLIIAIDGPSGVGKGTVARALAARLGYRHVDTGAMYRAVGWKARHDGVPLDDDEALARLAREVVLEIEDGVRVDGHEVTRTIRTPEMDAIAAQVASLPMVRAALVDRQRAMGEGGGIVMEGRDIGTVVFPDADVKLYLDALPEERVRRRASDPAHACGTSGQVGEVATALHARDHLDRTRAASPLTRASDAVEIDTTRLSIEAGIERARDVVGPCGRAERP